METTEMIETIVPSELPEDVTAGLNPVVVVTAIAVVAATVGGVLWWRKRKSAEVDEKIAEMVTDITPE